MIKFLAPERLNITQLGTFEATTTRHLKKLIFYMYPWSN